MNLHHKNMCDHIDPVNDIAKDSELTHSLESDLNQTTERRSEIIVVKIGGSTLGRHDTTIDDLVQLQQDSRPTVVVHGGGKIISQWMEKQGVKPQFINGLRVTDAQSLDIVISVLTGLINKNIVAELSSKGSKAIGISGVDGSLISASIANPEMGYVGKVDSINIEPLKMALNAGYIPVVAPVGFNRNYGNDEKSILLNINADTVAGHIAAALKADRMVFLTDVEGVLDSSKRLMPRITRGQADSLVRSNIIAGGMVPKIEACISALDGGAISQIIDGRLPNALNQVVNGQIHGTRIG
jgi:acetylglutamate kinase